jgi:hypothetical protein
MKLLALQAINRMAVVVNHSSRRKARYAWQGDEDILLRQTAWALEDETSHYLGNNVIDWSTPTIVFKNR